MNVDGFEIAGILPERFAEEESLLSKATEYAAQLLKGAYRARLNSFAPWSGTKVGAAVVTSNGEFFYGCNIEIRSGAGSMCAEQGAFAAACNAGDHNVSEIFVIKGERFGALPCGSCRQMIHHLAPRAVILARLGTGLQYIRIPVKKLLPSAEDFDCESDNRA
jgi:cytidine deaminase